MNGLADVPVRGAEQARRDGRDVRHADRSEDDRLRLLREMRVLGKVQPGSADYGGANEQHRALYHEGITRGYWR